MVPLERTAASVDRYQATGYATTPAAELALASAARARDHDDAARAA